jgi:NADH-quinone oxidoreductase subunit L
MAWFIDETFDKLVARPTTRLAIATASVFENKVIDGAVMGTASAFRRGGERARKIQNGYVRSYALGLVAGVFVLIAYVIVRAKG